MGSWPRCVRLLRRPRPVRWRSVIRPGCPSSSYLLEQTADAHRVSQQGVVGKIVIDVARLDGA